jgi:hypothetical protein
MPSYKAASVEFFQSKPQHLFARPYGPAEAVPLLQSWLLLVGEWLKPGFDCRIVGGTAEVLPCYEASFD